MEVRTAQFRKAARLARKVRIRRKISGTAACPRLVVFRSGRHIDCQVIDDSRGHTLAAASTLSKEIREEVQPMAKKEQAKKVGLLIADRCKSQGIESVVFDRNGFLYHGRVAALAEGAREGGLKF